MNQRQMDEKKMLDTFLTFMESFNTSWSHSPVLTECITTLTRIRGEITNTFKEQEQADRAMGKEKLALKLKIADRANMVCDLMSCYAMSMGKHQKAREVQYSMSTLYRMKNADFVSQIAKIVELATSLLEVLTHRYGMDVSLVRTLEQDYMRYLYIQNTPNEDRVRSVTATKKLKDLLKEVQSILIHQVDPIVKMYKLTDPNFFVGYKAARKVIKRG